MLLIAQLFIESGFNPRAVMMCPRYVLTLFFNLHLTT